MEGNPEKKESPYLIQLKKEIEEKEKNLEEKKLEANLQRKNMQLEENLKQFKKSRWTFDKDKLKFWWIAIVIAIFGAIILFKVISKFI